MVKPDMAQMTVYMAHVLCMLDKSGYRYTLRIYKPYCFCQQQWLRERNLWLCLYVHCLSLWFLFWTTLLYFYARVLMTDLFLLGSSPQQQRSGRTTMGGDWRTQGKAGRQGEMPAGDSKGPRHFMVCL